MFITFQIDWVLALRSLERPAKAPEPEQSSLCALREHEFCSKALESRREYRVRRDWQDVSGARRALHRVSDDGRSARGGAPESRNAGRILLDGDGELRVHATRQLGQPPLRRGRPPGHHRRGDRHRCVIIHRHPSLLLLLPHFMCSSALVVLRVAILLVVVMSVMDEGHKD